MIISDILEGEGISGVTSCHPLNDVYDSSLEPYEYNTTLAIEYLKQAGYFAPEETTFEFASILIISMIGLTTFMIFRKYRK